VTESRPYVLNCPTEYQWETVDARRRLDDGDAVAAEQR